MQSESNNNADLQQMYDECRQMQGYHVIVRMKDGRELDGVIESADPENMTLLMGEDVIMRDDEDDQTRQVGAYRNPRRYRRFRNVRLPLASLLGLSLLPYPYYAPPYPYAQPYPYYPY